MVRGCVSAYNRLCALPKHHSHLTAEWVKQIRLRGEKQPHLFPITPALLSWEDSTADGAHPAHVCLFNMDCEATVYPSDPETSVAYCDLFFQGGKKTSTPENSRRKNGLKRFPSVHSQQVIKHGNIWKPFLRRRFLWRSDLNRQFLSIWDLFSRQEISS